MAFSHETRVAALAHYMALFSIRAAANSGLNAWIARYGYPDPSENMSLATEAMKIGGAITESALREAQANTDLATGLVLQWAENAGVPALMLPPQG